MNQEEFRLQLSKVIKKGLDAVANGEMEDGEMIEIMERVQDLVECMKKHPMR